MTDLKHLVSPFVLVPSVPSHEPSVPSHEPSVPSHEKKATPRPAPPCNCDNSDEENDFGMAPECAFVCPAAPARKASRKRNPKKHHQTKTKRYNKNKIMNQ
jgi:hypothetical protein